MMGEREEQIVQRLVSKLKQHRYKDGEWLVLQKMNSPEYADSLSAYLNDDDEWVRDEIAKHLADIGDRRAISHIKHLIDRANDLKRNPKGTGVDYLRRKLGHIDPALEITLLIEALQHPDKSVRAISASRLRQVSNESVVESLISALNDDYAVVRWHIVNALARTVDERAIEPLIIALKDESPQVVSDAIEALAKFGSVAVSPVSKALSRTDDRNLIVTAAVAALSKLGDVRAVEPLLPVLQHHNEDFHPPERNQISIWHKAYSDADVRAAAALALGKIGDQRAVDPLIPLLTDTDLRVRLAALTALVFLGVAKLSQLTDLLDESDVETQSTIIAMLGELGDQRAFSSLIELLKGNKYRGHIGNWVDVAHVLAKLNYKQTVLTFIEMLEDRRMDPQERTKLGFHAGWCLSRIINPDEGNEEIAALLEDIIANGDELSRRFGREALCDLDKSYCAKVFIPALKEADDGLREQAIENVGMAGPDVVEPLLELLRSEARPYLRLRAVHILGNCGDEHSLPMLQQIAEDEEGPELWLEQDKTTVKKEAVTAIKRIKTREYILTGKEL